MEGDPVKFKDDCRRYFVNGLMGRNPGQLDGNAILYTGVYYTILRILGDTSDYSQEFKKAIEQAECYPGVFSRGPHKMRDRQSYDDYFGIFAGCYHTGNIEIAQRIYEHGVKHWWYYDNRPAELQKFTFSNYFQRMPGFIPTCRHVSAIDLKWWHEQMFQVEILSTEIFNSADDTSSRQKDFCLINTIRDNSEYDIIQEAIQIRDKKFIYKYPNGMQDVFKIYFEPTHPFAVHSLGMK